MNIKYTDEHMRFVEELRNWGTKWEDVAKKFEEKFGEKVKSNTLRMALSNYVFTEESIKRSTMRNNTKKARILRESMDALESQRDFLTCVEEKVKEAFATIKAKPPLKRKISKSKRKPMTLELLISDIHVGKLTESFNLEVLDTRLEQIVEAVAREVDIHQDSHKIEKLVLAFLGDIIESSTMHKEESLLGCEVTNSEQVVCAVNSLFSKLMVPLYQLGIPIHCIMITGNHDRVAPKKTFQKRGKENLSYIIYKMMEQMSKLVKMKGITFDIPEGVYCTHEIYGDVVLYEHGDESGKTKESMESRIGKRQKQLSALISFYRLGHWHEFGMYERGRIVINGSICGADDYSDTLGFDTQACQVLNFYCPTEKRPNSFYKAYPIYLD